MKDQRFFALFLVLLIIVGTTTSAFAEDATWKCSNGHENSPDNLFCGKCGEKKQEDTVWKCSNGHENALDNLFCVKCGEKKDTPNTTAIENNDAITEDDIKDLYTIISDIGDSFVVDSIVDSDSAIEVRCSIDPNFSPDNSHTEFVLCYGVDGNQMYHDGFSLETLKNGIKDSFPKSEIDRHNIPSTISLYTDIKDLYYVDSSIGSDFKIESIIDSGESITVRCRVLSDYTADSNTRFTVSYGAEGNCIVEENISLETLKRGFFGHFPKEIINQHNIPSVIMLRIE